MNLSKLALFLKIVEKGSMAAAGRELGISPTTVSEHLALLEAHYGVTLLNRTTRAIRLTDEGRVLAEGAKSILAESDDLDHRIRLGIHTLSGTIRISAPVDLGRTTIAPVIDNILHEHPAITVELLLSDGYVNIVDEGIDIAVRFGNLQDSTLRVRSLGEHHRVVCASPDYIGVYGKPLAPVELEEHNCLVMRFGTHLDNTWHFRENDHDTHVIVRGNRIANDGGLVHAWALAGFGIALKSRIDIQSDLETGALVELLSDYAPTPIPIQMLFPPGRAQPRRIKFIADQLAAAFESFTIQPE